MRCVPLGVTFPKARRLLKAAEFLTVLQRGEVNLNSGPLRIRAFANRMRTARLGLTVPKRGNRLAVRRNRIKRVVREQFRQRADALPALDIVVHVRGDLTDGELRQRLGKLLDRLAEEPRAQTVYSNEGSRRPDS